MWCSHFSAPCFFRLSSFKRTLELSFVPFAHAVGLVLVLGVGGVCADIVLALSAAASAAAGRFKGALFMRCVAGAAWLIVSWSLSHKALVTTLPIASATSSFEAEAPALADADIPNMCMVRSSGEHDGGGPTMVVTHGLLRICPAI